MAGMSKIRKMIDNGSHLLIAESTPGRALIGIFHIQRILPVNFFVFFTAGFTITEIRIDQFFLLNNALMIPKIDR